MYVRNCKTCRLFKANKEEVHTKVPRPPRKFQMWGIDFVSMDNYKGYHHILTAVCHTTNWGFAASIKGSMDAEFVIKLLDNIVYLCGEPDVIRCDRGPPFSGQELAAWASKRKFSIFLTAAYNPVGNGLCESFNKNIVTILSILCQQRNAKDWPIILKEAVFFYNARYHSGLKMSPYEAVFGIRPLMLYDDVPDIFFEDDADFDDIDEPEEVITEKAINRAEVVKVMKGEVVVGNLASARRLVFPEDLEIDEAQFEYRLGKFFEGNIVLYHQPNNAPRSKMDPKWDGPYEIIRQINGKSFIITHLTETKTRIHVSPKNMVLLIPRDPQDVKGNCCKDEQYKMKKNFNFKRREQDFDHMIAMEKHAKYNDSKLLTAAKPKKLAPATPFSTNNQEKISVDLTEESLNSDLTHTPEIEAVDKILPLTAKDNTQVANIIEPTPENNNL